MATFTITTPVNIDSLAGKAGSDTYNINGGYLTIDQDSRYGLNQTTDTTLGAMTLNTTQGGSCEINATKVRIIPFSAGSGTVPASNTVISKGGASGLLLGVYASLSVAPTAVAASMPTSGFIKVKQWNDVAYSAGALTGITANATGADRAGWIEVVATEISNISLGRLNLYKIRGEYFDLGTTDGNRSTTYQIPSNGVDQYHAGVEVETGAGTGVYKFFPCAGTLPALYANIADEALRGSVCWISTDGNVRFGSDGTNSTGGYIVPAGRKVRIANVFLANCTVVDKTQNAFPNAVLNLRCEFATGAGGVIDFDKCSSSWYFTFVQAYSVRLTNLGVCSYLSLLEIATPIYIDNVCIGQEGAGVALPFNYTLCPEGGIVKKLTAVRASQIASNSYVLNMADIGPTTFTDIDASSLIKAVSAVAGSLQLTRSVGCTFTNYVCGGGRNILVTAVNTKFYNTTYYDKRSGNTPASIPFYAFELRSSTTDTLIDGFDLGGLYMCQPLAGILSVSAYSCIRTTMVNIGTYASPLSLGSPRRDDQAWTRSGTVATVTSIAHNLEVGNSVSVPVSSNTLAVTTVVKIITSVPTPDTFTFACLNAGTTSGTLCYFGVTSRYLFVLGNNYSALDTVIKRVYAPHTSINLYLGDNSSTNLLLENVFSDYLNAPLSAVSNSFMRNVSGTPNYAPQLAIYGTHWSNGYVCDVAENTTAQAWTRSGTTITVTSPNHALRTGLSISVTDSSSPTGATLGYRTVIVIDSSTFTFTGTNAGATSGTLDYRVGNGRIALSMNEATAATAAAYTIDAGTPAFTSAGTVAMANVGDQITFEQQEYVLGQGSTFPIMELAGVGGTLNNYDFTYALDKNDGAGYSSFRNLYILRSGGGGANGSFNVTMTDTTGVNVGDYVWGTNIAGNAKVVSITDGTTIVVDTANIGTVSGTLRFNHLPSETGLGPAMGIKMKWRIKTVTANVVSIGAIYVHAESTNVGRTYQYPLTTSNATFSFSGLEIGTTVAMFDSANVELDRKTTISTDYSYAYKWNSDDGTTTGNYALIWKDDKLPIKFENIALSNEDLNVLISQADDLLYDAVATDNVDVDFSSSLIIMDTGATEYDVNGVYSIWKDTILLTNNAQYDFAFEIVGGNTISGVKSIPFYVFQANGWKVRPQEASHTLNVVGGVLVGESSSDPFVDTLGAYTVRINYEQPVQAITVSTSIPFTPAEVADAVWDETASDHVSSGTMGKKQKDNLTQNNFLGLK